VPAALRTQLGQQLPFTHGVSAFYENCIYNADDGRTYSATMTMSGNTMNHRLAPVSSSCEHPKLEAGRWRYGAADMKHW
jgi:hypothetical protein